MTEELAEIFNKGYSCIANCAKKGKPIKELILELKNIKLILLNRKHTLDHYLSEFDGMINALGIYEEENSRKEEL